jgi:hypothetical protein
VRSGDAVVDRLYVERADVRGRAVRPHDAEEGKAFLRVPGSRRVPRATSVETVRYVPRPALLPRSAARPVRLPRI